jgi:lipid-binding SYLF domain-containing protein
MKENRRRAVIAAALGCALPLPSYAGLFAADGKSKDAQRAAVRKDRDQILARLYKAHPEARAKMRKAVGYGTFNNMNVNLFLLSTGHGYGMVVDQRNKKETFLAMASLGGGVGMGVKDLRAVFIFYSPDAMKRFVDDGWQFGGEADATAKTGNKGAAVAAEGAVDTGGRLFEIYQLTEHGISLQATIAGTRYWKDDELNRK